MLYTKLNLDNGDLITARSMNFIETIAEDSLSDVLTHDHDETYLPKIDADASFWSVLNGTDCDADMLQGFHASELMGHAAGLPIGSMAGWDGALGSVPAGWQRADGTNGTIDMRNVFPVCSSATHAIGSTYGANIVTPTGGIKVLGHSISLDELPSHRHGMNDHYCDAGSAFQAVYDNGTLPGYPYHYGTIPEQTEYVGANAPHGHEGSFWKADDCSNIPPFLSLYIIERVS